MTAGAQRQQKISFVVSSNKKKTCQNQTSPGSLSLNPINILIHKAGTAIERLSAIKKSDRLKRELFQAVIMAIQL